MKGLGATAGPRQPRSISDRQASDLLRPWREGTAHGSLSLARGPQRSVRLGVSYDDACRRPAARHMSRASAPLKNFARAIVNINYPQLSADSHLRNSPDRIHHTLNNGWLID